MSPYLYLQHSIVYRSGITAQHRDVGDRTPWVEVDGENGFVRICFRISSAGGGTTFVEVKIGKEDLPAILGRIAAEMPEIASAFLELAATADKRMAKPLDDAQKPLS